MVNITCNTIVTLQLASNFVLHKSIFKRVDKPPKGGCHIPGEMANNSPIFIMYKIF